MKDLKQCRIEIDAIDQQLMELFEKRMALSKSVVEYKIENPLKPYQMANSQHSLTHPKSLSLFHQNMHNKSKSDSENPQ